MKKIEIIIQERFFKELINLMASKELMNYSVVDISKGHGDKGDSLDYGFLVDHNIKLISICSEAEYELFKNQIAPYVKTIDGLIYASIVEVL